MILRHVRRAQAVGPRAGASERKQARAGGAPGAGCGGDVPGGRQVPVRRGVSWLRAWALARITSGSNPAARAASAASR